MTLLPKIQKSTFKEETLSKELTYDAARVARVRDILPTTLGTAGIRANIAKDVLARNVFSARVANAHVLTEIKRTIDLAANDEIGEAEAIVIIMEAVRKTGYTPEGGFPDTPPGLVPHAVRGSLEDLSSYRRAKLIVETQVALMAGAGEQMRGHTPDRLAVAPAWELVRIVPVSAPRDWPARWVIAGGEKRADGRMIALKGDPVWGELGASGNFDDALDVDHPPFAFNSGMGWAELLLQDVRELGIKGPGGESIGEWLRGETRPRVIAGELPLPAAPMSVADIDPEIAKILQEGAEDAGGGKLQPEGDNARAKRRAERKARSEARWAEARSRRTNVEAQYR